MQTLTDRASLLIRVYGDSLALPRYADGLDATATYAERIRLELQTVRPARAIAAFNRSRGGAGVTDLRAMYEQDVGYFGRDARGMLILHCGVVDCAPRPLPPAVRSRVAALPALLRWPIAKFLHLARPWLLRAGFSWRTTTTESFETELAAWIKAACREQASVYVINISPALASVDAHSPGLSASIVDFNGAIRRSVENSRATLIDIHGALSSRPEGLHGYLTGTDGYHLTAAAHAVVAELILGHFMRRAGEANGDAR